MRDHFWGVFYWYPVPMLFLNASPILFVVHNGDKYTVVGVNEHGVLLPKAIFDLCMITLFAQADNPDFWRNLG